MASSPSIAASKPESSPSPCPSPPLPAATKETLIARFIITPLIFLSFIVSLSLIDYRNTSSRIRSHKRPTPRVYENELLNRVHGCVYREVSNPYSYVRSPGTEKLGSVGGEEKDEQWHWNTKQRKMMRMEVGQAFEVRETVLVVMVALGALLGGALVFGLTQTWRWLGR